MNNTEVKSWSCLGFELLDKLLAAFRNNISVPVGFNIASFIKPFNKVVFHKKAARTGLQSVSISAGKRRR